MAVLLFTLFITFFKIGLFTFGGGYAMLPLIQAEVASHGWMEQEALVNFIAVSESTPGPFAINISTYIGTTLAGIPGAVCATLGVVLPSFIIILIVAHFYEKFKESKIVKGCMSGLRPAVIGLIASAILSVGKTVFFPESLSLSVFTGAAFWVSLGIFAFSLFLALKKINGKKVHPILIICLSAAAGIAAGYLLDLPI